MNRHWYSDLYLLVLVAAILGVVVPIVWSCAHAFVRVSGAL